MKVPNNNKKIVTNNRCVDFSWGKLKQSYGTVRDFKMLFECFLEIVLTLDEALGTDRVI